MAEEETGGETMAGPGAGVPPRSDDQVQRVKFDQLKHILELAGEKNVTRFDDVTLQVSIELGRVTLPIILLLPRLGSDIKERLRHVVTTGEFQEITDREVLEIVRTSGVIDEVHQRATRYADRAVQRLQCLPEGEERNALAHATSLLVDREV